MSELIKEKAPQITMAKAAAAEPKSLKDFPYLKEQNQQAKNCKFFVKLITPTIAHEWLTKNVNNRELNKQTVRYYADLMLRGQWRLTHQTIAFDEKGNLQDGQHRLQAVLDSGMPQYFYVFQNMPLANFMTLDTNRARRPSDTLYISGYKKQHMVMSTITSFLLNMAQKRKGVAMTGGSNRTNRITNEDVLQFVKKNEKILQEAAEVTNKTYLTQRNIDKAALGGYFILFSIANKTKAREFMKMYATGVELTDSHPILILREILQKDVNAKKKLSRIDKLALLVKAWNYYISGKNEITTLRFDARKEEKPEVKNSSGQSVENYIQSLLPA